MLLIPYRQGGVLHNDQIVLPVLENGRKLVGLVRFPDVFDTISGEIITEYVLQFKLIIS
jgi:hypothetical protein